MTYQKHIIASIASITVFVIVSLRFASGPDNLSSLTRVLNEVSAYSGNNVTVQSNNATDNSETISEAMTLLDASKYNEAMIYIDKALAMDPNDIRALNGKGLALYYLDKNDEAITYFDKVLAIDPSNRDALYNKANALYYLERYEDAIEFYDKVDGIKL